MPSRRVFLTKAAVAAAALSATVGATKIAEAAQPDPASSPHAKKPVAPHTPARPAPAAPRHPAKVARELAAYLAATLPQAHLSPEMTEKIALDINDNLAINKAFRNRKKRDLPPPDFIFTAADGDQS